MQHAESGETVLWAGFSVNSLSRLIAQEVVSPIDYLTCFVTSAGARRPSGRVRWINGRTMKPGSSPTNGCYFTCCTRNPEVNINFVSHFSAIGRIVAPYLFAGLDEE